MTAWPTLETDPVHLPDVAGVAPSLWASLLDLSEEATVPWTLVGGQMVVLHALEAGVSPPRVTTDLDAMVNARVVAGATRRFVEDLDRLGFELVGADPTGIAHRYGRDGVEVDVLAPEGLGRRADLTTTPPGRTIEVPGGTQALERTELLPVRSGDLEGLVPRPSLLGAIVGKAMAVEVGADPSDHRSDLAFLLTLVEEPGSLLEQVTKKDRQRLARRAELLDAGHPAWVGLGSEGERGRAVLGILTA